MKKIFFILVLSVLLVMSSFNAKAFSFVHEPFLDFASFDVGGAISRGVSAIIKFFLGDDNKLVAQLVYDGEGGGSCSGGCGGAYTGAKGSADDELVLNAVASPLTDIPAETKAYPDDIKIQDVSIGKLADLRTKEIMKGQASLDELSVDKWAIEYRAQQRAIQAMTDALVMKKAYKDLAAIAEKVSSGSYSDYSAAASTVATRRLMLDALMALRKRVIAARVRARAETMEAEIDTTKIPTQATIDEMAYSSESGGSGTTPQNTVANNDAPGQVSDLGTGANSNGNGGN